MYTVAKYKGVGCQKVSAKDYLDAITLYYNLLVNNTEMSITDVEGISCHLVDKFKDFFACDVGYCTSKLYEFIRSAIYRDTEVYDYLRGNNEFINVDFTLINCVHESSISGIVELLIRCKMLMRLLGGVNKNDTITYLRKNNFSTKFVVCGVSNVNLSPFEDILYIVTFNGKKWISIEDVITNIKCMISYICSDNKKELRALYDVIREDTSYLQVENTLIEVSFDKACNEDCYLYEIEDVFFKCELESVKCVGDLQDLFYVLHFATRYLNEEDSLLTLGDIAGYMLSHAYLSRVGYTSILNDSRCIGSVEYDMITKWCLHGNYFIGNSCMHIHQSYCVKVLNTYGGRLTNGSVSKLRRTLNLLDRHKDDITISDGSIVIDGYVLPIDTYIQPRYLDMIDSVEDIKTLLHTIYAVLNTHSALWNTTIIPLNVVEVFKCLSYMSADTLTCGIMLDVGVHGNVYVRNIDEDSSDYIRSQYLWHMLDYSGVKTYKEVKESNRVMSYVRDNIKNYLDSLRLLVNGFKEVCTYKGIDKVFLDCESQSIDCFGYMIALHNGKNRRVIIDCPNLSSTIYHMCMDCFHEGLTENSLYEMLVALNRLYGYLNDALANVGLRDEYYEVLKDISHDLFVVEEMFNKVMGHSKCVNHKADNVSKQLVQDFIDNGYVLAVKDGDDIVVYTEDKSKSEVVPKSLHKYFYNIDSIDMLPLVYYVYHCEGY